MNPYGNIHERGIGFESEPTTRSGEHDSAPRSKNQPLNSKKSPASGSSEPPYENLSWNGLGMLGIWISVFLATIYTYKSTPAFALKEISFAIGFILSAFFLSKIASKFVGILLQLILVAAILIGIVGFVAAWLKNVK